MMKSKFFTVLHIACLLVLTLPCHAQDTPLLISGKAFGLMFRDSIPMEVELLFDADGLPDFYRCYVNTPVCNDGLCRSLILDVYWDLLGNFTSFVVPECPPLTKWDHLEFTAEDYNKLGEILRDRNSVLGNVSDVNTLFDPSTKRISEKVDAVTGATRETIKNAVVPGAVYSSYTLWRVVNGEIPSSIQKYTESYRGPSLISKFLLSDNYHYHYNALDYLLSDGYEGHFGELIEMLEKSDPFVTRSAVSQFPQTWLDNEHQLHQVLKLCDNNRSDLSDASIAQLGSLLQHDSEAVALGTYQILEKLATENKNARKILIIYEKSQDR
jgi:hypothetical protein